MNRSSQPSPGTPSAGGPADASDAEFDALLQQRLDERRDPLDDPRLVAWLDAHPEQLAAFAALRDDLQRLGARPLRPTAAPRRGVVLGAVAFAAAAAAAAAVLTFALRGPATARPAATHSPGRVLAAHLDSHAPRLYAAADFVVREPWPDRLTNGGQANGGQANGGQANGGTTLHLETYQLHHVAR